MFGFYFRQDNKRNTKLQNTVTQDFISAPKQKQALSSFPFNKAADKILLQYVEKRLNKIFFDEVNSSDSIFKKVSNNAVYKMALFLSGNDWGTSWKCKYYVPMSAVDDYKKAPYWKDLGDNIVGYDFTE